MTNDDLLQIIKLYMTLEPTDNPEITEKKLLPIRQNCECGRITVNRHVELERIPGVPKSAATQFEEYCNACGTFRNSHTGSWTLTSDKERLQHYRSLIENRPELVPDKEARYRVVQVYRIRDQVVRHNKARRKPFLSDLIKQQKKT